MEEQLRPIDEYAPSGTLAARLRAQNDLLLTLFRMSARLAAESGAPDFAVKTVQMIVETLPRIDLAGLWLLDHADKHLRLAALHSAPGLPSPDAEAIEQLALRPNEGAAGIVLADAQPLLVPDADAFERSVLNLDPDNVALLRPFAAQLPRNLVVIYLPLQLGSLAIGVLELFDIGADANLTADELPLLQAFADQLAVVVRNAQIYIEMSEQHRRLQAFDAVVTAITSASDIDQMLEQALSVTLYVVGAQRGFIALLANDFVQIEVAQQFPGDVLTRGRVFDVEHAPFADVVRLGEPGVVTLPLTAEWDEVRALGVEALAQLPLLAGGTVVGILAIACEPDISLRLDWASLLALGSQIGIAVANYQLYSASQRERRRLAGVIASIAEGVIICDRQGLLVLSNQAAETIVGRSLDAGMSLEALAQMLVMRTLDDRPLTTDELPLARSLNGTIYQNYEVRVTNGFSDELVISCSGAPLLAEDGTIDGAVVSFRDLTAYKKHEALRDEFVAVAAHELRAPLAAVKGYTDLLLQREMQRPGSLPQDKRGIQLLARQTDHLVRLVDNLLDVSRLDAGRLELYLQPADLINLLEASIDRISIGDNKHRFVFNGPSSLPIVCDQLRLQQVFTNLLSNAARYSPSDTQITVEVWTESCSIEAGVSAVHGDYNECVVVAVRDEGVGMTPDVQAKVFDRYYRANTATAASGLGLGVYLSREIVQRHGGRIWLESVPGRGSSFYVMLPLTPVEAA